MKNKPHIRSNNGNVSSIRRNTATVGNGGSDGMIKLKCDYSPLAEMFGRSRDPITSGEHPGRDREGQRLYGARYSPDDGEEERGKSEERDRVADWLDSRQEAHTLSVIQVIQRYGNWSELELTVEEGRWAENEGWIIPGASTQLPPIFVRARGERRVSTVLAEIS